MSHHEVVFDAKLLGLSSHVSVGPDGYTKLAKIPPGVWHCTGSPKSDSELCWDTLLRLSHAPPLAQIHPRHITAMSTVAPGESDLPWAQIVPTKEYKDYFKNVLASSTTYDTVTAEYYLSVWKSGDFLTRSLKSARIDSSELERLISSSAHSSGTLETFRPKGGYAPRTVYDRFKTVTGRFVVESGPNILHLKREHRHIILPSTPSGKIVYLDFSSLEARILLYEAGGSCEGEDLYTHIAARVGNGATRAAVKGAVLAELYGSSRNSLALSLGISNEELSRFIKGVRDVIDTRSLLNRLRSEHEQLGWIRNKFGRRLDVQKPQDNIFVNYYAQSTGVDVAMMGFWNVLQALGTDGVRPLFLLHDALVLDVREDRLRDVESLTSISVKGFEHAFPLKCELI